MRLTETSEGTDALVHVGGGDQAENSTDVLARLDVILVQCDIVVWIQALWPSLYSASKVRSATRTHGERY
jgi:hypothetical protein